MVEEAVAVRARVAVVIQEIRQEIAHVGVPEHGLVPVQVRQGPLVVAAAVADRVSERSYWFY